MRTLDVKAIENFKRNIDVLSEQYNNIVASMPGQYALFKLSSERLSELLTTNDEYNQARKNAYEYKNLSTRLERYLEDSGNAYSIDNAEELQDIIDSFNRIAKRDSFYFDGDISVINSKIEEMRVNILNMEPFDVIENRINSSEEIDDVFKKLALTKQKAVETKISADYEIVKAYGAIAGLDVPLDGIAEKYNIDEFYFYDNKKENNDAIAFENKENTVEYDADEKTEPEDNSEWKRRTGKLILVEPVIKHDDENKFDPDESIIQNVETISETSNTDNDLLPDFDFSIPSFDDITIPNISDFEMKKEEQFSTDIMFEDNDSATDAPRIQEDDTETESETASDDISIGNHVDFGLKSFIDLQKPIDDVEIMNNWWSKLQRALDDAGCEIDMKCPEDICRIIICEISKMDKNDYVINTHYATDASRRPIDLNSISDEEILERQNTGSLDYLCMKHIYRASQEGRLFVRDHPRTKGHMAPRQILVSNHNEPYVGNDIFHLTDEEKLIGSLLDEPAAMEKPGIGTKFKAIFGDDKASREIKKFNSPEDDFTELLNNWNRIKEIEAENPAFVKIARNNMIVSLYYFGNPEIGSSQKKYVMNLYELHKRTLNRK